MKKIVGCILLAVSGGALSFAQQAISSAGGEASGAGGTVSFTVGQPEYTSLKGNSGSVMQGVQLPYEIQVITGLEINKDILLECEAYPNPATDFLILKVQRDKIDNLSYRLFDINGKLLEEKPIGDAETNISLRRYPSAAYFLKVINNSKEIKIFKITKY